MKKDMSNVDILAVLTEFREQIRNSWIDNIYQINSMFIYRFRKPDEGSVNMLVQTSPLQRIHITEYVRTPPKIPPPFCMTLRKYLRNKRVVDIQQHEFDRVVIIEVSSGAKIVIELFGRGNMLLLDPEGQIIIAQYYKKMKDRDLLPKKKYLFPPSRGLDIFNEIDEMQLKEIVESSTGNIIRTLTHFLNIKKLYAEEICLRSNIEATTPASDITENEIHAIIGAINSIFQPLNQGLLSPEVVYENSMPTNVTPIHLRKYSNLATKKMPSFNEGLDFYFGEIEKSALTEVVTRPRDEKLERLDRIRDQQKKAIEELHTKEMMMKKFAEKIYLHSAELREILHTIESAYKKGITWKEILNKIEEGKKKGIHAAELIKTIDMANKNIIIELEGKEIAFGLDQSVEEVASNFYEAAKKQAAKIEGAKEALQKTLHKIEKLKEKGKEEIQEETILKKKRKRKWYEKYRWFISSDGILVLGGRDMTSNKILFKRYMDPDDLFMHAEVAGAPYVIIKTRGDDVPETTLQEAAQFSVSYSRAWRGGLGAGDAYYVLAAQVSETAPSGEYIPKGGVMVRGDRNYLKNNPLKIAVGVKIEEEFAIPISGPPSAISHQTENYVLLVPGEISSGKVARQIKGILLKRATEEDKNKIKLLSADEIIRILPPGNSKILKT